MKFDVDQANTMDSKYNIGNKTPTPKFKVNIKPRPILFDLKNGPTPAKKLKLTDINMDNNSGKNSYFNGNKSPKINNIQEQKRRLPIFQNRNKLLDLIRRHTTLIILGETGSGKTTQVPQYIFSARLQSNGIIGVTQPRRVAAISIAMRVAQEMGNGLEVGDIVGYNVRFEDVTSNRTKIKYLTDGMLLREAIADNFLMKYTVIVLDEAHERTINTDVLFGIVKQAQKLRLQKNMTPLKIILMSATMDVDHFSKYFNNCQAVYLEGRTFPVNIFYTTTPHDDYQTACVATFFKIHKEAPPNHDVLIFLTGQEEIEAVAHQIRTLAKDPEVMGPPVRVCPLYASQSSGQQMSVFQSTPENTRKVVISTNVAETSITISGIRYVIDSGMVKLRTFYPSTGLETLRVSPTSQDQAWQRAGRAGRDSDGTCYRLYTRAHFTQLARGAVPEILRANLAAVALQLLALGVNALRFDWIDKPPREALVGAFEELRVLGAVVGKEDAEGDEVKLTEIGKKMAKFPLDPKYSKILLSAETYECLEEVLTIVAVLSGESIYLNLATKREAVQAARDRFHSAYGDHLTLLNVYREYNNVGQNNKRSWCHEHYINMKNILYAREVRTQLAEICKQCEVPMSSCGGNMDPVRKCLLAGLFTNVAQLQNANSTATSTSSSNGDSSHHRRHYTTLHRRQTVHIHPSSALHGQQPSYVIYTEVMQTSKCYLRGVTTVEGGWLQEVMPVEYVKARGLTRDISECL